jgi:hypothetical protein
MSDEKDIAEQAPEEEGQREQQREAVGGNRWEQTAFYPSERVAERQDERRVQTQIH